MPFYLSLMGYHFLTNPPSKSVHLDACPSGLGAIFDHQVYTLPLPSNWRNLNIAYTELINILVALAHAMGWVICIN